MQLFMFVGISNRIQRCSSGLRKFDHVTVTLDSLVLPNSDIAFKFFLHCKIGFYKFQYIPHFGFLCVLCSLIGWLLVQVQSTAYVLNGF